MKEAVAVPMAEGETGASVSRRMILGGVGERIDFAEAMSGGHRIIDVRSPKEYDSGSLAGAVNVPVFDNDERHLVGTIYRHGGKETAVDTGFSLVQARLDAFLSLFEPYRGEDLAIFCARGGMRSRSVVNLLRQHGHRARQLDGGYKHYRQLVLGVLASFQPRLIVLHGLTGTGKTRLLQRLESTIDLEDLAQHQSSMFGGLNRQPRTQKNFDTHLHRTILGLGAEPFFIEGESRKLGGIYLPEGLARAMKAGVLVEVTASLSTRVARIVEDYPVADEATARRVRGIFRSLSSKLSRAVSEELCSLLDQGRMEELVAILLVEYYDRRYANVLRGYRYHHRLSSENLEAAARELTALRLPLEQEGEWRRLVEENGKSGDLASQGGQTRSPSR